jgi:hypothetical protein
VLGTGLAAIVAATVLVIVIRSSAQPVFVIGVLAAGIRATRGGPVTIGRIWQVLGVPVLAGLCGAAVALGTLGRLVRPGPPALAPVRVGDGSVRCDRDGGGEQPAVR